MKLIVWRVEVTGLLSAAAENYIDNFKKKWDEQVKLPSVIQTVFIPVVDQSTCVEILDLG